MTLTYQDSIVGTIRPSVKEDCLLIASDMRKQDIEEASVLNFSPSEIAMHSFDKSIISMTILHDEIPIAMFGIMPEGMSSGVLWMVTTYGLENNGFGRPFVRNCKKWFNDMLEIYPLLWGTVDLRNETSIRWLTYLGCQWGDIIPFGIGKTPFRKFSFKKDTT